MERICIALFPNRAKAEPARDQLLQAGFHAEIREQRRLGLLWFVPKKSVGARLEVQASESEAAEHLLLEREAVSPILKDAMHCPDCGSLRVKYPQTAEHSLLTNFWIGLSAELGLVERDYYCEDCHFTWPKEGTRPSRKRPNSAPYYFIEGVARPSIPPTGASTPAAEQHRKAA